MRIEDFTTSPRSPITRAEVHEGQKRVWQEDRPPSEHDLKEHLSGRLALGLIPDKALSLDFDSTSPEELRPLVRLFKDLGIFPYYGPGTTRGSRLWLFLEDCPEDLEALAKGLLRLAEAFGYRGEAYPNGRRPIILPCYGASNGQGRPLFDWQGRAVSLPFEPTYTPPEALHRVVLAGELFMTVLQRRPTSRHDAALAFMNLASRLGVLEETTRLFKTRRLHECWGLAEDQTRTLESWADEVTRLQEAAGSDDYDRKRGLPFLKEQGYTFPDSLTARLEDWPRVRPLTELEAPLPPWHRGPVPQELEALAEAQAASLGIEPTPIVLSMLAVVSGLLAHKGAVIAPDGPAWEEAPGLWVALVGGPGSGKTPSIKTAARPLWAVEKVLAEHNRQQREEYEAELASWQAAPRKERGPKPQPEPEVRLVVSDATPEKLAAILEHNKGVVAVVDELKGLLATWKREDRAHARAFFLSAYNGHPVVVDRIMRGTSYLERPMLALLGGIQIGPWHELIRGAHSLSGDADGLLQRLTPVVMEVLPPLKDPQPPDARLIEAYENSIWRIWEDPLPERLTLSQEARATWKEWVHEVRIEERNPELPEAWRAYLSKRLGLTLRVAGILAVLHGEVEVSARSLESAIFLLRGVLEPHARRAWGVGELGDLSPAIRLGKRLIKGDIKTFTRRDVYTREWGGIRNSDEAGQALRVLERAGWITYSPEMKAYRVSPRLKEVRHV